MKEKEYQTEIIINISRIVFLLYMNFYELLQRKHTHDDGNDTGNDWKDTELFNLTKINVRNWGHFIVDHIILLHIVLKTFVSRDKII